MSADLQEALRLLRRRAETTALESIELAAPVLGAALEIIEDITQRVIETSGSGKGSLGDPLRVAIREMRDALEAGRGLILPPRMAKPLVTALDNEIRRWEERAASDPEARAVLRTFLALREFVWEFARSTGMENAEEPAPEPPAEPQPKDSAPPPRASATPRVRRFDIEG